MPQFDPIVTAAIWAFVGVLFTKGVELWDGRASKSRAERDEIREILKETREEARTEFTRRREIQAALEAEHEKNKKLTEERDLAEAMAKLHESTCREIKVKLDAAYEAVQSISEELVESNRRLRERQALPCRDDCPHRQA